MPDPSAVRTPNWLVAVAVGGVLLLVAFAVHLALGGMGPAAHFGVAP